MKMFEKVAANLEAIPSEVVAALNVQLADERNTREELEHKLVQVEDALSQTKLALSQIIRKDIDHDRSGNTSDYLILTVLVFLVAGAALWFSGATEPTAQGPAAGRRDFAAPRSTMRLLDSAPTLSASKTQFSDINPDADSPEAQISDAETSISTSQTDYLPSGSAVAEDQIPSLETKPDLLTHETQVSSPASRATTYVSLPPLAIIRSKPDLSAPVLQRISQGTRVQVVAQAEDWFQLELKGVNSGWIHHSLLRQDK